MRKMKAMISQPMRGKSREEILKERNETVTVLELLGYEVVDTVFTDNIKTLTPLQCLSKSLAALSKVDLVVFLAGWDRARGCTIEKTCCDEYGVPSVIGIEGLRAQYDQRVREQQETETTDCCCGSRPQVCDTTVPTPPMPCCAAQGCPVGTDCSDGVDGCNDRDESAS
jgi:hypothetical protein